MSIWYKILKYRNDCIINGRLVQVEAKQACYYRYIIHESNVPDWSKESTMIKSEFKYTSGIAALSAGKSEARNMPVQSAI